MARSPSSSAQQAREALAARLKEAMRRAGLDGTRIAHAAGWHPSKSSRILTATTLPSVSDIEIWCRLCGVPDAVEDLVAQMFAADEMYSVWKRRWRAGMATDQATYGPQFRRHRRIKVYSASVVPGFLQTFAYAQALLSTIARFNGVPDHADAAAAARLEWVQLVHEPGRTFAFLIEESVLHYRVGAPEDMADQLVHLLTAMTWPAVSVGVIPMTAQRPDIWVQETFSLFDDARANVELLTAEINITTPSEVAGYTKAFTELSKLAVYGAQARTLVGRAFSSLE